MVRILTLGGLALTLSGCSLLFVDGPPRDHEQRPYFQCTESQAWPTVDAVLAAVNLFGTMAVHTNPDEFEAPTATRVSGVFWTLLHGWSASQGFDRTRQCHAAREALALRVAEERARPVERPAGAIVAGILLEPEVDTLRVGEARQLTATAYSSAGVRIPEVAFRWSSLDAAVATVNQWGRVRAEGPGSARILVHGGGEVAVAEIAVEPNRR